MQKQTLNQNLYLVCQATTSHLEIGLFQAEACKESIIIEKHNAQKSFLITLEGLLQNHNITIHDIDFCVVNRGPSPFTLLRTVLSYINALQISLSIPIVGIDGFVALAACYESSNKNILILQNAFAQDIYYYYCNAKEQQKITGCAHKKDIPQCIKPSIKADLLVLGNGYSYCENLLPHLTEHHASVDICQEIEHVPLSFLGTWAYNQLQNQKIQLTKEPIMPLYLKHPIIF